MSIHKPIINNLQEQELKTKGITRLSDEQIKKLGTYDKKKWEKFEKDTINNPKVVRV